MGVDFSAATLANVSFENCMANFSNFVEARLKQVLFIQTTIQSTNYYNCEFNKIKFDDCELNKGDFYQTSLKGIDLSTCTYEILNVTPESLDGCIVSADQAIGFSKLLGLHVKP